MAKFRETTFTQLLLERDAKEEKQKASKKRKGKLTMDQLVKAVEADDNIGFCLYCNHEQHGVEPDARRMDCEECGMPKVFGAEELLLMGIGV